MRDCVWMRVCDVDGIEQSSVMVIDDYTFYCHSIADGAPALIDYEHTPGESAQNARELVELAHRLQRPDGGKLFAGRGTELLRTAA